MPLSYPDAARALADQQAELREGRHRAAVAQAADAFRARDFREVVRLLEETEPPLSPAERDKLAYARQHS